MRKRCTGEAAELTCCAPFSHWIIFGRERTRVVISRKKIRLFMIPSSVLHRGCKPLLRAGRRAYPERLHACVGFLRLEDEIALICTLCATMARPALDFKFHYLPRRNTITVVSYWVKTTPIAGLSGSCSMLNKRCEVIAIGQIYRT